MKLIAAWCLILLVGCAGSTQKEVEQTKVLDFSDVEEKPRVVEAVDPVFPKEAAGIGGTVFLKLLIGSDGRVRDVQVVEGPEIFRQPMIDAFMQWRFKPARHHNKPVSVWVYRPYKFFLQEEVEQREILEPLIAGRGLSLHEQLSWHEQVKQRDILDIWMVDTQPVLIKYGC